MGETRDSRVCETGRRGDQRTKRQRAGVRREGRTQREVKPRANKETKSLTKVKGVKVGTWKGEERLRDEERTEVRRSGGRGETMNAE